MVSRRIAERHKYPRAEPPTPRYRHTPPWECSSVVEHCVDIAGVASSILATPTIENPAKSMVWWGFWLPGASPEGGPCPAISGQILGIFGSLWANSGHANAGRWKRNPESRTPLKPSRTAGDSLTQIGRAHV